MTRIASEIPRRVATSNKKPRTDPAPPVSKCPRRLGLPVSQRLKAVDQPPLVLTVGHSTRTLQEFVALLLAHGVKQLVDVRTIPRSRHNPQFNQGRLPRPLQKAGIRYRHMPGLGGLRHALRDSINTAWRNASFRGFESYLRSHSFNRLRTHPCRFPCRCIPAAAQAPLSCREPYAYLPSPRLHKCSWWCGYRNAA